MKHGFTWMEVKLVRPSTHSVTYLAGALDSWRVVCCVTCAGTAEVSSVVYPSLVCTIMSVHGG